jgi:hypothetical protein
VNDVIPSEYADLLASTAPAHASTKGPERPHDRDGVADRRPRSGGPIEEIRPGDRVYFEPREEHWHGAAPDRFMIHIAMQESDDSGSPVTWGEHVSEEEYGG